MAGDKMEKTESVKHDIHDTYLICGLCGAKTRYYRNRQLHACNVCEHRDPKTGEICSASRKPLR